MKNLKTNIQIFLNMTDNTRSLDAKEVAELLTKWQKSSLLESNKIEKAIERLEDYKIKMSEATIAMENARKIYEQTWGYFFRKNIIALLLFFAFFILIIYSFFHDKDLILQSKDGTSATVIQSIKK